MYLKNQTTDTISLIDRGGLMTVATPGLSLINGNAEDIEQSIEYSQLDLEVLRDSDIVSMTIATFGRLVNGQMTLEALRSLKALDGLKVGSRQALEAIAA